MQAPRASGPLDQEIFDATVLTAFRLAFSTINDALGVEPDLPAAGAAEEEFHLSRFTQQHSATLV